MENTNKKTFNIWPIIYLAVGAFFIALLMIGIFLYSPFALLGSLIPLAIIVASIKAEIAEKKKRKELLNSNLSDFEIRTVKCINKEICEFDNDGIEITNRIFTEENDFGVSKEAFDMLSIGDELNFITFQGEDTDLAYVYKEKDNNS